jgi:hypothetical protein
MVSILHDNIYYLFMKYFNIILHFLIGIVGGGVQLGPLGTAALPALGDYDDGEIGGMIGRGNRSTRRKPAPMLLCPPQSPHACRTRTRAAAVESQRVTASTNILPFTPMSPKCPLLSDFPY